MSTKRTIPCDHCGEPATLNRLKLFRTLWHNGHHRRPGRTSWMIHPGCWTAFELKMARAAELEALVRQHGHRSILGRLAVLPYLWKLKRSTAGFRHALTGSFAWIFRKP